MFKTCSDVSFKKKFNFESIDTLNTADTTPLSTNSTHNYFYDYFVNSIDPYSELAKDLHRASQLALYTKPITEKLLQEKKVKLPNTQFAKTIVLDLDETLVHTTGSQTKIRPYCSELLESLSKISQVVVFTASAKDYASKIIKMIDPKKKYISFVCYRESCIGYTKDLSIFGKSLKDIVLVDNCPQNFITQINNGIPIIPYEGVDDDELLKLKAFLERLVLEYDMTQTLQEIFRLQEFYKEIGGKSAIQKLYQRKI